MTAANPKYHHQRYAGSIGDLWKHWVFASSMDILTASGAAPLQVIDSHAGSGIYQLKPGGRWFHGIGSAAQQPAPAGGLPWHFEATKARFFTNAVYYGSWPQFLERADIAALTLIDHCSAVAAAVTSHLEDSPPTSITVDFRQTDSFDYLASSDLKGQVVVIDPAYSRCDGKGCDWQKLAALAAKLESQALAYLIWYPIYGNREPNALIRHYHGRGCEAYWSWPKKSAYSSLGCGVLVNEAIATSPQFEQQINSAAQFLGVTTYYR